MNTKMIRRISVISALVTMLVGAATMAQAEQVQARVISSSPMTQPNGSVSYQVTYEYAGRPYTTHTNSPPGASIWVDANGYGVTTPVPSQSEYAQSEAPPPQSWSNVVPERGVVVSGGGAVAPGPVYAPAPVYVQPAPAPVYYPAPAYYPAPTYAYPPIGISLGFGYSRGWR